MQTGQLVNKALIIASLPLFSDLSFFQKRFVESRCQVVAFKKGAVIYNEGAPPDFFYCVVSGRVELCHPPNPSKKLKKTTIECVLKGDYFGSISSLTGKPHSVSARALNDSALLSVDTKDFKDILQKIPRLAIFLSHSLSRRLSRKPFKEIFESKIVSIYSLDGLEESARYARSLSEELREESGKKVLVVKPYSITNKKDVSPMLSSYTGEYHYVLVTVPPHIDGVNLEIFRQSDSCHIISSSGRDSLRKTSRLIKRLEALFVKHAKQNISVILKEDKFYSKSSYENKRTLVSREIFAILPEKEPGYKRAIRRIAREVSGVRIGLALGSGAAYGLAHIGVLKVLEGVRPRRTVTPGRSVVVNVDGTNSHIGVRPGPVLRQVVFAVLVRIAVGFSGSIAKVLDFPVVRQAVAIGICARRRSLDSTHVDVSEADARSAC